MVRISAMAKTNNADLIRGTGFENGIDYLTMTFISHVFQWCFSMRSGAWKTAVLISLLFPASPQPCQAQLSLWLVEKRLSIKYPVHHMDHKVLAKALASGRAPDSRMFSKMRSCVWYSDRILPWTTSVVLVPISVQTPPKMAR